MKFTFSSIFYVCLENEEALCEVKPPDTLNVTTCIQGEHDASPKPLSRSKEKRGNRSVPIRQPLTDHINR